MKQTFRNQRELIINAIVVQRMKIYQVSDEIWETYGEEQGDVGADDDELVGVDDDEPVGDDEEVEEAYIRVIEESDKLIPRGVDEFITSHIVTNELQDLDHTHA